MANTVIQYCFHEGEHQDQIDLAFDQRISQPREHLRVEVLMPGGTTYFKDIKYIVIEGGTKLRLLIKAQPQWFMSNRVSDDVEAATVRAGAGGNLNSTRLRSHRKAITDITDACAGDPKFEFTIKLKKKCDLNLTDRDDMGYTTGVTAEVVYYKHGNPYFQPYQDLGHNLPICVLHLNLLVQQENTGNTLMSPQGDRVAAGVGRPGGPPGPGPSQGPMYHYQPPPPPPGYWGGGGGYPPPGGGYPPQPQYHQPYPPPPHAYGGQQGPYGYPPAPAQGGAPQPPQAAPGAPPPYGGNPGLPSVAPPYGWGAAGAGSLPLPVPVSLPTPPPPPPPPPRRPWGSSQGGGTATGTGLKSPPQYTASASTTPAAEASASASPLGGLSGLASRFFNTTPRNSNGSQQVPVRTNESFMPTHEEYDTTVDEVAQDFGDATVITEANTTTTAQQTGRDSRRRSTRSSTGGNLKSPNKYNY